MQANPPTSKAHTVSFIPTKLTKKTSNNRFSEPMWSCLRTRPLQQTSQTP